MNKTMKLIFDALMDEETFSTPVVEEEWGNILKFSGAYKNLQLENDVADAIGKLWNSSSENAFEVGFRTAVSLLMSK